MSIYLGVGDYLGYYVRCTVCAYPCPKLYTMYVITSEQLGITLWCVSSSYEKVVVAAEIQILVF